MTTPDEHLTTLRELAGVFEQYTNAAESKRERSAFLDLRKRQVAALRWAIEQNAWGVTDDEVVG